MKDVIFHKATLEHLGKACVATFAAFCAALAPRVITALATSDPMNVEINLFGEAYLKLAAGVSLAIGIGTMLMMWKQPFDPPKIFTMALTFPALFAGGLNMTESVQELATKTSQAAVKSIRTLEELNIHIEEPETILESESLSTLHFSDPSMEKYKSLSNFRLIESAYADNSFKVDRFPLQISQLIIEKQYLIILKAYTKEEKAKEELAKFKAIVSGATIVRTKTKYYVVASGTPSSISDATQKVTRIKELFSKVKDIAPSLSLLPIKSGRK